MNTESCRRAHEPRDATRSTEVQRNTGVVRRERYLRYQFPWRRVAATAATAATVATLCAVTPLALAQARVLTPSPCPPVRVMVDSAHAPANALDLVAEASARVTSASAIPIVVDARVDPPRGDYITVRWRPLAPATPVRLGVSSARLTSRGATGTITLNTDRALEPSFSSRKSTGAILMHEIGHAIGLGHSPDPADVMFPQVQSGPLSWGPGDLTTLAAAGAARGCTFEKS